MKRLRLVIRLLVAFDFLNPAWGLINADGAAAQSIPTFNPVQLQIPATGADFNTLINLINANVVLKNGPAFVVNPAAQTSSGGITSGVTITGGFSQNPPTLSATSATLANVDLAFKTQGTGLVEFATPGMWFPVAGLAPCPGYVAGLNNPIGMGPTVNGYLAVKNFLAIEYFIPTCGVFPNTINP